MLTVRASSSHRSDVVRNRKTTAIASEPATKRPTRSAPARAPRPDSGAAAGASAVGAAESIVMSTPGAASYRRGSAVQVRDDLAHEPLEALARRVVPEPEHELPATGVDEALDLLGDLVDGADEVVP